MVGDRRCFDVVITDDALSEYTENFPLDISLRNGSYHPFYSDSTTIYIWDNDGECMVGYGISVRCTGP